MQKTGTIWRLALPGLCTIFIGIGLARFAYTPLLPAIIQSHWFTPSDAAYLGAANLAGYLLGALIAAPAAHRIAPIALLRVMMIATCLALFACASPVNFAWFFVWRFIAGISGAVLMVLSAPTILPHVAPSRRGVASGLIFTGAGLGVAASGTLVPVLMRQGLAETWIGLGILASLLTIVAWRGWPSSPASSVPSLHDEEVQAGRSGLLLRSLYVEYGLAALGLVPHMIFLVDYIARGLGQGLDAGASYWVLFGIGAMAAPVLCGWLADRIGLVPALRLGYAVAAFAVALPLFGWGAWSLMSSSMIVGGFIPGVVTLTSGRVGELTEAHGRRAAWGIATTSFAMFQAAGAYGMSYLFAQDGGDYRTLFELGTAAMLAALATNLIVSTIESIKRRGSRA